MFRTTKALVLREVKYKEADRMLTLLTPDMGKVSAKAAGALRKTSKTAAATQFLCYSDITLYNMNGKWSVKEASTIEEFSGLRNDIAYLALGNYFAECLENLSQEDVQEKELLQLGLNSLYALSRNMYDPLLIKAGFEFRSMCVSGYTPDLARCSVCGDINPKEPVFFFENGTVACRKCAGNVSGESALMNDEIFMALRYFSCADPKKVFSFPVDDSNLKALSLITERYVMKMTERRFASLDYWKKVK